MYYLQSEGSCLADGHEMIYKGHDNKNKHVKRSRLFEAKIREVVRYFAADLTALQAAALGGLNRNTVNRLCRALRERMLLACEAQRRLFGVVEVDESFFGARRCSACGRGTRTRVPSLRPHVAAGFFFAADGEPSIQPHADDEADGDPEADKNRPDHDSDGDIALCQLVVRVKCGDPVECPVPRDHERQRHEGAKHSVGEVQQQNREIHQRSSPFTRSIRSM